MKIKCFAVGCPKHPLFSKRKDLEWWAGSSDPEFYGNDNQKKTGKTVNCFEPTNHKISEGRLDVDELKFSESYHYYDGFGMTIADWEGDDISVYCEREEFIDKHEEDNHDD
jgi:hypothetical protein